MTKDKKHKVNNGTTEDSSDLAKDVAASVDDETFEAVEGDLKNGRRKRGISEDVDDVALEDALDAAGMVSEGGPVDEPAEDDGDD